jgi:hypothetical protein
LIGAFLGELQSLAAAAVVEPDLARAEGTLGGEVLAATRYSESGDQFGSLVRRKVSLVTCCGFEPSRFMIQRLSPPARSLVKAIHFPFGE